MINAALDKCTPAAPVVKIFPFRGIQKVQPVRIGRGLGGKGEISAAADPHILAFGFDKVPYFIVA